MVGVTQASYLARSPRSVAARAPKNAHLGMGYVDLLHPALSFDGRRQADPSIAG